MSGINQSLPSLKGRLNIYTMEVGDGRDIELAVVEDHICWRRVGDKEWVKLVPLSDLSPQKGVDYWTPEDKQEIVNEVDYSIVAEGVPVNNLLTINEAGLIDDSKICCADIVTSKILDERLPTVSDKYYAHDQESASSEWHITHTLNKYPSVTVVDSAGTPVVGEITYTSMSELSIKFSGPFSGKAFLN